MAGEWCLLSTSWRAAAGADTDGKAVDNEHRKWVEEPDARFKQWSSRSAADLRLRSDFAFNGANAYSADRRAQLPSSEGTTSPPRADVHHSFAGTNGNSFRAEIDARDAEHPNNGEPSSNNHINVALHHAHFENPPANIFDGSRFNGFGSIRTLSRKHAPVS